MSSNDQAIALLTQLALATDGAIAGVALAYVAVQTWRSYISTSTALRKIREAPTVKISDLRYLLSSSSTEEESELSDGKLVVIRGLVEAKAAVDGNWRSLRPNVLISHDSGERAVLLQRTQTVWKICTLFIFGILLANLFLSSFTFLKLFFFLG